MHLVEVLMYCRAGHKLSLGKCRSESSGGQILGGAARSAELQGGERDENVR